MKGLKTHKENGLIYKMLETNEFYSYEDLKHLICYTTNKHKNLQNVLKYLSNGEKWSYTDWTPIYSNDYEECPDGNYCQELRKSVIYNMLDEKGDYTHYHCSCSEAIIHPTQFRNIHNNNHIVIGSICYKKFGKKAVEIMDAFEGKKKCEQCNKTVNKQVVNEYEKQETFYHKSCLKKTFDICKKCKNYTRYDCECKTVVDFFSGINEEPEPPSYEDNTNRFSR